MNTQNYTSLVYPGSVSSVPDSTTGKVILYGDANLDQVLSINDATCIQRYLAGLGSLNAIQQRAADVSGEGSVDITDSTLIQRRLANIIDHFPVEE